MSVAAEVENQTVLAFDSLAARYDDLFTRSMIGRAQRGAVWDVLLDTFEPGSHILELNCGTGEDALFLAQHDVSVVACDASEANDRDGSAAHAEPKTRRRQSSSSFFRQSIWRSFAPENCSMGHFPTFPD